MSFGGSVFDGHLRATVRHLRRENCGEPACPRSVRLHDQGSLMNLSGHPPRAPAHAHLRMRGELRQCRSSY